MNTSFLEKILEAIISPTLQGALLPLRILFIVFAFLFLAAIIILLFKSTYLDTIFFNAWKDYAYWKATFKGRLKKSGRKEEWGATEEFITEPTAIEPSVVSEPVVSEKEIEPKEIGQIDISKKQEEQKKEVRQIDQNQREILGREKRTDWERILDKIASRNELNYKLALLDADKLLNQVLEKQGKELSPKNVSNFDKIQKVRQLLNKMMAKPKARLRIEQVKEIIAIYRKALLELKAI